MHPSEVSFPLLFPLHVLFLSAASCKAGFLLWLVAVRSHGYLPGSAHMYLGLTGSADFCYYLHWVSKASFFLQPLTTLRHIFKEFTHIYLVQATHWHFSRLSSSPSLVLPWVRNQYVFINNLHQFYLLPLQSDDSPLPLCRDTYYCISTYLVHH